MKNLSAALQQRMEFIVVAQPAKNLSSAVQPMEWNARSWNGVCILDVEFIAGTTADVEFIGCIASCNEMHIFLMVWEGLEEV